MEHKNKKEAGVAAIIGIIFLLAFFFLAALVTDILRAERTAITLQLAADAASLAGALELDQTQQGWNAAKLAVFATLRKNAVFGDESGIPAVEGITERCSLLAITPFDISPYRCSEYDFSDVVVRIERGLYYQTGTAPSEVRQFRSLEQSPNCIDIPECVALWSFGDLEPVWAWGNGVRVTLRLKRLPMVFARVPYLSIYQLNNIEQSALATDAPRT